MSKIESVEINIEELIKQYNETTMVPDYKPERLAEIQNHPVRVMRRLYSSMSSGDYYILSPENYGINNAPFEPLFSVISSRFYYIRVVRELMSELDEVDITGCTVPVPRNNLDSIKKFLEEIREPAILINGWCSLKKSSMLHRISEVFVFDKEQTVEDYKLREQLIDCFLREKPETTELQGHLRFAEVELKKDFEKIPTQNKTRVFNHVIQGEFNVLRLNNEMLLKTDYRLTFYSYNHPIKQLPGGSYYFVHPFPSIAD